MLNNEYKKTEIVPSGKTRSDQKINIDLEAESNTKKYFLKN